MNCKGSSLHQKKRISTTNGKAKDKTWPTLPSPDFHQQVPKTEHEDQVDQERSPIKTWWRETTRSPSARTWRYKSGGGSDISYANLLATLQGRGFGVWYHVWRSEKSVPDTFHTSLPTHSPSCRESKAWAVTLFFTWTFLRCKNMHSHWYTAPKHQADNLFLKKKLHTVKIP